MRLHYGTETTTTDRFGVMAQKDESAPKFSGIILDFIKTVMLIFGFSKSPLTNY